jgi:membrane protein
MELVEGPTDLTVRAWWQALRDAAKGFDRRNLTDRAAALTYYSVLSVFPGLIVLVSLLGVVGTEDTIDGLLRIIDALGPQSAVDALEDPIRSAVEHSGAASVALVAGLVVALWSASGYVGAFTRASNLIYDVDEDRPIWKRRPLELLITVVMVLVLAVVLLGLFVGGPLADAIGDEIGIGDTALKVWSIAKWPVLFAIVVLVLALLYRVAPNARHAGLRWILPGSLLATLLWIIASAGFSTYVSHFGSYSNTYGGLAGVVVFLIWIWLTNVAVLFGAQFAAELERTGAAAGYATEEQEFAPFVSPAREEPTEPEGAQSGEAPVSERAPGTT